MKPIEINAPVVGQNLVGREKWVRLFIRNFANKPELQGAEQYALVSPRRTGKTSILLETYNRLFYHKAAGENVIPLSFDLEEILTANPIDTFPECYLLQLYACFHPSNKKRNTVLMSAVLAKTHMNPLKRSCGS